MRVKVTTEARVEAKRVEATTIVAYKEYRAIVTETLHSYIIDLRTGLGSAEYEKTDWTLEEALEDQANIFNEQA